jgi:hypothetical protein
MKILKFKLGEKILITDGVFKGIQGTLEKVENNNIIGSGSCNKASIIIDSENTIIVPVDCIKRLNQDYLILITNEIKNTFKEKPYVITLNESEVENLKSEKEQSQNALTDLLKMVEELKAENINLKQGSKTEENKKVEKTESIKDTSKKGTKK